MHALRKIILCALLAGGIITVALARQMNGVVLTPKNRPVTGVEIRNVHTGNRYRNDSTGRFTLPVDSDNLVIFNKEGYQQAVVRIAKQDHLPFYTITMNPIDTSDAGPVVNVYGESWERDSTERAETYKSQLNHFKPSTGLVGLEHITDYLSKRNRQIWAFQKNYVLWEQQRYVDYNFNSAVIGRITNLGKDSTTQYMGSFRPTYYQLRTWTRYQYYRYLKETVNIYRREIARQNQRSAGYPATDTTDVPFIDYHD